MKTFFKDIETLKKFLNITGNFDIDKINNKVLDAQEFYIKPYLGKDLFNTALDYYNATNPTVNSKIDSLLPYIQNPLAQFAVLDALPELNVVITANGLGVVSTPQLGPASRERTEAVKTQLEILGWRRIENLLAFLEENVDDYDDWKTSEAYTTHYDSLITTAAQFDSIIPINKSRLEFKRLLPDIISVQLLRIEPSVSAALLNAIKEEIKEGEVSERFTQVLNFLRRSIAFYTFADYNRSGILLTERHTNLANAYLESAVAILNDDPDTYPEYKESHSYNANKVSNMKFDNTAENSIFVFGG